MVSLIIIVIFVGMVVLWDLFLRDPRLSREIHNRIMFFLSLFRNVDIRERRRNAIAFIAFAIISCIFILPEMVRWLAMSSRSDDPTALLAPFLKFIFFLLLFLIVAGLTFYLIWKAIKLWKEEDKKEKQEDEEEG